MRSLLCILLCVCIHAVADPADWMRAEEAYGAGRYREAAQIYAELHEAGYRPAALYYNYATALFQQGDTASAIAAYRKAEYLAPRDHEIAAQLLVAIRAAGGQLPAETIAERVGTYLSRAEWLRIGLISYGICLLLLTAALFLRAPRRALYIGAAFSALSILLCVGGLTMHRARLLTPEFVTREISQLKLAPIDASKARGSIPSAALVRGSGRIHNDWIEVIHEQERGWIKRTALLPLLP